MSIDPVHLLRSNMIWLSVKSGCDEKTTVKQLNYMEETDEFTFTVVTVQGPLKLNLPRHSIVQVRNPDEPPLVNNSSYIEGHYRDTYMLFDSAGAIVSFIKTLY